MYYFLALEVLFGTFLFFALFGGSAIAWIEKTFKYHCPNFLLRASFAVTLSVVISALAGILVAVAPFSLKTPLAILLLSIFFLLGSIGFFHFKTYRSLAEASKVEKVIFIAYLLFSTLCLILACSNPTMPPDLPDGAYVSKEWTRGVKIQYITGNLPADNVIPFTAAEYFLRNISFQANHPMLPGQEVTNRPVMTAAIVTPVLAAIAPPDSMDPTLPTFSYVKTQWPDFRILVRDDRACTVYLAVMIALNAALLLGVAAFFNSWVRWEMAPAVLGALLFTTSPYFIFQTIFTWPKDLAAFFILLALTHALTTKKHHWITGCLVGLAYLSHPYAGAFLLGFCLYYLVKERTKDGIRNILWIVAGFVLTTFFWFAWKKHLNLPSDLVSQNFSLAGQGRLNFVWARLTNLLNTFLPVHLLAYPFNLSGILIGSTLNVAGAVGLLAYGACLYHVSEIHRLKNSVAMTTIMGLPCLLLVAVFSNQAVPVVHGLQVLVPLLVFGIAYRLGAYGSWFRNTVLGAQILINTALFTKYLISIGIIHS